ELDRELHARPHLEALVAFETDAAPAHVEGARVLHEGARGVRHPQPHRQVEGHASAPVGEEAHETLRPSFIDPSFIDPPPYPDPSSTPPPYPPPRRGRDRWGHVGLRHQLSRSFPDRSR